MSNEDVNPYTTGLTFMDNPDDWASQAGGLFNEQAAASPALAAKAVARGDSLVAFLSKQGGLSDQGGELAGRNADLWHRDLPFRRRLISQTGLDMGDAAQRALDAGYFPELGRDGSISGSDLLSAIEGELRGKPRYSRELSGQGQDALGAAESEARWGPQGQDLPGDMPEYGARPMPQGEAVFEQQPTTQGVDYLIRGLDAELEGRKVNGKLPTDPLTRSILDTRQQLRTELNRLAEDSNRNPAYVSAVREAGDYLGAKSAFDDAQKDLFRNQLSARDFAERVKKMTPAERKYAQAGASNAVWNLAQRGALKPNSWPPMVSAKLRALLGDDAVNSLDRVIADEATMTATERVVPSANGSGTFGWGETARDQDRNFLADMARNSGVGFMTAGPKGGIAAGVATLAQKAADMIPNGMSIPTRDALGRVLMAGPDEAKALLNVPRRAPIRKAIQKGAHSALTRGSGRFGGWSAN